MLQRKQHLFVGKIFAKLYTTTTTSIKITNNEYHRIHSIPLVCHNLIQFHKHNKHKEMEATRVKLYSMLKSTMNTTAYQQVICAFCAINDPFKAHTFLKRISKKPLQKETENAPLLIECIPQLISSYLRVRRLDRAHHVATQFATHVSAQNAQELMQAFAQVGDMDMVMFYHNAATSKNTILLMDDEFFTRQLALANATCGQFDKAIELMQFSNTSNSDDDKDDMLPLWNAFAFALSMHGRFEYWLQWASKYKIDWKRNWELQLHTCRAWALSKKKMQTEEFATTMWKNMMHEIEPAIWLLLFDPTLSHYYMTDNIAVVYNVQTAHKYVQASEWMIKIAKLMQNEECTLRVRIQMENMILKLIEWGHDWRPKTSKQLEDAALLLHYAEQMYILLRRNTDLFPSISYQIHDRIIFYLSTYKNANNKNESNFDKALHYFGTLPCLPTVKTVTAIMEGHVRANQIDAMLRLLEHDMMNKYRLQPTLFLFNCVIHELCKKKQVAHVQHLLQLMRDKYKMEPGYGVLHDMIELHAVLKQVPQAQEWYQKLKQSKIAYAHSRTYAVLIRLYAECGMQHEACLLFDEMMNTCEMGGTGATKHEKIKDWIHIFKNDSIGKDNRLYNQIMSHFSSHTTNMLIQHAQKSHNVDEMHYLLLSVKHMSAEEQEKVDTSAIVLELVQHYENNHAKVRQILLDCWQHVRIVPSQQLYLLLSRLVHKKQAFSNAWLWEHGILYNYLPK